MNSDEAEDPFGELDPAAAVTPTTADDRAAGTWDEYQGAPAATEPAAQRTAPQTNAETGEENLGALVLDDRIYAGISSKPVNDEQMAALLKPVESTEVEIRPDGAVYLAHSNYRRRLNAAFRPGGWAMRPLDAPRFDDQGAMLYQRWALMAEGRFLAQALGEQKVEANSNMSYGDQLEGAKSNALMRCCKDLGMAMECWDRSWSNGVRDAACVKVWIKFKKQPQWRRLTDAPFQNEERIADDSPNRADYIPPSRPATDRPATRPASAPPASREYAVPGAQRLITDGQRRRLYAIAKETGVDDEVVGKYIRDTYKVERSSEIRVADYDTIVEWVKAQRR